MNVSFKFMFYIFSSYNYGYQHQIQFQSTSLGAKKGIKAFLVGESDRIVDES